MYEHLRGVLQAKQPTRAVVDVGGVGYELTIPLSTFEGLPAPGETVTIHTHHHVREDAHRLFGFATRDERRFFRRLMEVQGIGPAVALSILSSTTYAEFRAAILNEEPALLVRLKGVGRKLAQRMILDLRDALAAEAPEHDLPAKPKADAGLAEDAANALMSLGFKRPAARREVERILSRAKGPVTLEELVREALRSAR
jgi:Holliday junction DNA helicase RuvA